jgi:hypothetical protein
MRKLNGLSLNFTDFYVPALTPRLNSTDPSLQLYENITLFAICGYIQVSSVMTDVGSKLEHRQV